MALAANVTRPVREEKLIIPRFASVTSEGVLRAQDPAVHGDIELHDQTEYPFCLRLQEKSNGVSQANTGTTAVSASMSPPCAQLRRMLEPAGCASIPRPIAVSRLRVLGRAGGGVMCSNAEAMSVARHHAEWLSLVEVSGPFLSMPVLLEVFPDGLEQRADHRELRARLHMAHEEWLDACPAGAGTRPGLAWDAAIRQRARSA